MTTSRKFSDDEGTFEGDGIDDRPCRKCNGHNVKFRIWESSDGAYEDYRYSCPDCGAIWWVDGIDS
jgi:hypothetical protein